MYWHGGLASSGKTLINSLAFTKAMTSSRCRIKKLS
jgi:hypothetical protein